MCCSRMLTFTATDGKVYKWTRPKPTFPREKTGLELRTREGAIVGTYDPFRKDGTPGRLEVDKSLEEIMDVIVVTWMVAEEKRQWGWGEEED